MIRNAIFGTIGNDRFVFRSEDYDIRVFSGNNSIVLGDGSNLVTAEDGKNSIKAGDGANFVTTGAGQDNITLGAGNNTVRAGGGKNRVQAGDGDNVVETGDDSDRITVGLGSNTIRAGGGRNKIEALGDTNILVGDGDDDFRLGDGTHVIHAGAGKNSAFLGDGEVEFVSGLGNDRLSAGNVTGTIALGDGKNKVSLGDGDVTLSGGAGADRIQTGDGDFSIDAGAGKNQIRVGNGSVTLTAGDDADRIQIGDGDGVIEAGGGRNRIALGDGRFEVSTGSGKDQISFGDGDVVVTTTGGDNRISGGDGKVTLTTGAGKDNIRLGSGDAIVEAVVDAGDGKNRVQIAGGTAEVTTGDGNDAVSFGDGDLVVLAGAGDNRISTGDGTVRLSALDGRNSLKLGEGEAIVSLGDGDNRISIGDGTHEVTAGDGKNRVDIRGGDVTLSLGNGQNRIKLGAGDFSVSAGDGGNTVALGDGSGEVQLGHGRNKVTTRDGDYVIDTGDGDDAVKTKEDFGSVVTLSTAAGKDRISVGDGDNVINSGAGDDIIRTGDGQNTLLAGAGNDKIKTGAGDDRITGGAGDDQLDGGAGTDTAVFLGALADYRFEDLGRSMVQVTAVGGDVADLGTDRLRGIEYLAFEGDGTVLDIRDTSILDTLSDVDLRDDTLVAEGEGVIQIALADLLDNDPSLGTADMYYGVSFESREGAAITFDGTTITYNAEDSFQHLSAGEVFSDLFYYWVVDGTIHNTRAAVNVTLTGENDAPVTEDDQLNGGGAAQALYEGQGEFELTENVEAPTSSFGKVAALKGGHYVSAWSQGYHQGKNGIGVRVFDEHGTEDGTAFVDGDKTEVVVNLTALEDGGFALIWRNQSTSFGANENFTLFQTFNPDGTPRSNEIEIVESDGARTTAPVETIGLRDGNLMVVLAETVGHNGEFKLMGQRYSPQGDVLGDPIVLDTRTYVGSQNRKLDAAATEDGGFVLTWTSYEKDTDQVETTLYARVFDGSGVAVTDAAKVGSHVETKLWESMSFSSVAVNDDGSFAVTWQKVLSTPENVTELYGRVFDADGEPRSEAFLMDTHARTSHTFNVPLNGEVAWLSGGHFVATWTNSDGNGQGIHAQVFNADGRAVSDKFQVNDLEYQNQTDSDLAVLSNGRFVVSWYSNFGIKAQVFEGSGEKSELPFTSEDKAVTFKTTDLLWNDADLDGDELQFILDSARSENGATLSYDPDDGTLTYDPTQAADIQALRAGDMLEDRFTYTVSDGSGGFDQASVTVLVSGADEMFF